MEVLYHFTAARYAGSILRQGLTRGYLLINNRPIKLDPRYRWLTTNPDWQQTWAEGTGRLPYRTNEARLQIEIPDYMCGRLLTWNKSGPILSHVYDMLSEFGDPENWRLFQGNIPADWIKDCSYNPQFMRNSIQATALMTE